MNPVPSVPVHLGGDSKPNGTAVDLLPVMYDPDIQFVKASALDPVMKSRWQECQRKRLARVVAVKDEFPDADVDRIEHELCDSDVEARCGKCRLTLKNSYEHFQHSRKFEECAEYVSLCSGCNVYFKGGVGLKRHLARSELCRRKDAATKIGVLGTGEVTECEVERDTVSPNSFNEFQLVVDKLSEEEINRVVGSCKVCSKSFKGKRGLKAHLARSICGEVEQTKVSNASRLLNRCSSERNKSEALPSQDSHHSATAGLSDNREQEKLKLSFVPRRSVILWPKMCDDVKWLELDKRVNSNLLPDLFPAEKKLSLLETVLYDQAVEVFGCVEEKESLVRESRRQVRIRGIRKQIRDLLRQMKATELEEVKSGLLCVIDDLKERRRELRRAENRRKRRWKRDRWRRQFYKDPFKTAKEVLDPKVKGELVVEKDSLNEYVRQMSSDPKRDEVLLPLEGLEGTLEPLKKYYCGKLCESTFEFLLKKKRNKSRPGPDQLPYKVYKKCPLIKGYLFKILSSLYQSGKVPLSFRISDGVFIPKVEKPNSNEISDFRQIALMNCGGKMFWSMIADGLYRYLVTDNGFIDVGVQKGSIRDTPGCWEHTAMMWSALKDSKLRKKSLAVLWLDLANAYGSVPHQLIIFALRRYSVPERIINLVMKYYWGLWGRSSSRTASSDWFLYEVGIFAGCTLSVILFLLAFNIVIEYLKLGGIARFRLSGDIAMEPFRAFMDDLSILTPSVSETERALRRTEVVLNWARMKLKAQKSRSVVINGGRPMAVAPFAVDGVEIPSLQEKPLKTLGRFYDASITDEESRNSLKHKLLDGLRTIDKSKLSGFMKVWTLQHLLLPKVQWQLMLYDIPLSWVQKLEQTVSKHIRKWLGVSRNLTGVALYSRDVPCPLTLTSLSSLFKTTKVNAYLQLRQSGDEQVRAGASESNAGRAWLPSDAAKRAESRLWQDELVGVVPVGRSGFGTRRKWKKGGLLALRENTWKGAPSDAQGKDARSQWRARIYSKGRVFRQGVVAKVREEEGERLMSTAVQQRLQGQWTRWKDIVQRDLGWKALFAMKPHLMRFAIGSTYDTLSSPTNLKRWGFADDASCVLCGVTECTISHVLSGCRTGLQQGRFSFRHDSVLRVLADVILGYCRNGNSKAKAGKKEVMFVKAGEKVKKKCRRVDTSGVLDEASDWDFMVDLKPRLVFPVEIVSTTLRPDIVIVSRSKKLVVIIELTCPSEEHFDERHNDKLFKYMDLVKASVENGWCVTLFAVEVGARGYASHTVGVCLKKLGIAPVDSKRASRNMADAALRASFWIWLCRETVEWGQVPKPSGSYSSRARVPSVQKRRGTLSHTGCSLGDNVKLPVSPFPSNPRGLKNIGNSCYMNASLQCVFLLLPVNGQHEHGIMHALTLLYEKWRRPGKTLSTAPFWRQFSNVYRQFRQQIPHDSHEFLTFLLTDRAVASLFNKAVLTINLIRRCTNCRVETRAEEEKAILGVPVQKDSTMQKLITASEVSVPVEGYNCPGCGQPRVVCVESVRQVSDVVVVGVKRFSECKDAFVKDETSINDPLSGIVLRGEERKLRGVVVHQGSRLTGHYVAVVKYRGGWFLCSDAAVRVLDSKEAEAVISKGYLYFFLK